MLAVIKNNVLPIIGDIMVILPSMEDEGEGGGCKKCSRIGVP